MMSPKAVHAYAQSELGMGQVHLAGALRVDVSVRQDSVMKAALANVARGY